MVGFLALVAVVLFLTWRYVPFRRMGQSLDGRMVAILTATLIYALIMPRFRTYSFILLLPAALYVITHRYRWSAFLPLVLLIAISADPGFPTQFFTARFAAYWPIIVTAGLFLMMVLPDKGESRAPGRLHLRGRAEKVTDKRADLTSVERSQR